MTFKDYKIKDNGIWLSREELERVATKFREDGKAFYEKYTRADDKLALSVSTLCYHKAEDFEDMIEYIKAETKKE